MIPQAPGRRGTGNGHAGVAAPRRERLERRGRLQLQGRGKAEVRAEAGEEQVLLWRRGYRVRPPQGEPDDDPRYAALPNVTPLCYRFPAGQPGQPG